MNTVIKAHVALFAVNAIYAANYTVAKEVMPQFIEPFGFILLRVSFACALFLLLPAPRFMSGLKSRLSDIPSADRWRLFACGFFGIACNQLLFFKGLNWTTPIHASLIMTSTPVLVLIMSAIILGQRITLLRLAGIALGLAGAVWLILSKGSVDTSLDGFRGDLLVFINAASYAVYLVLVKPLLLKYHPWLVIKLVFCSGFVFVFPAGLGELMQVEWHTFPLRIWMFVLFVLLLVTFLTYLLNIYALSVVQPSIVSVYIYLQPLLATAIALAAARDHFEPVQLLSAVLIFAGVYLVSLPARSLSHTKPPEAQPGSM